MRKTATQQLEAHRRKHPMMGDSPRGSMFGYFQFDKMAVISSGEAHANMPWEHVSVSFKDRCPTWEEMSFVKDLFWLPTETVIQIHPPRSKHINFHEFCLHLWKNVSQPIQLPPEWTIA
jgi:hypothetical protein